MRIQTTLLVTVLVQLALASPRAVAADSRLIAVCLEVPSDADVFPSAKRQASRIFKEAGIKIEWYGRDCPSGAIQIKAVPKDPPPERPTGVAYSRIPEREVVIFFNRLKRTIEADRFSSLLAHVIVHETTHILQGFDRHSEKGVMKTNWNHQDYARMGGAGLTFTKEDIELIHRGMNRRADRLWAAN